MEQQLSAEVLREVLLSAPRPLQSIKAELLLLDGLYLLHYREGDADKYKFLSPSCVRAAFEHEEIDSGWISPEIQRTGSSSKGNWVVLFIRPQKHRLDLGELGIATVTLPGLVFYGLGKSYWVWATKTEKFDRSAQTYRAPLPNVSPDSGLICWGNVSPPDCSTQTIAIAWKLFVESTFNSHWAGGKSVKEESDVRKILMNRTSQYPLEDLVPHRYYYKDSITVDDLVSQLIKSIR